MNPSHALKLAIVAVALGVSAPTLQAEPLGKQLADYARSDNTQAGKDCYDAVHNRLAHIYTKNGKALPAIHGTDNQTKPFKMLWVTNFDFTGWSALSATFRACGPAGALASKTLATLVPHKDIWEGKLQPGAIVQVWDVWKDSNGATAPSGVKANGAAVFNALHAGQNYDKKMGHAFIFLEYEKNAAGQITGMQIADQGTGWNPVAEKKFGLWIGANLID